MFKKILPILAVFAGLLAAANSARAGKAERVVVIVWDGMRPDFVTEQTTPTLFKMAQEGVTFAHHHSVYPTSTEVNGTALATGMYPNRSGLIGNREYRPEINPLRGIDTQDLAAIRKGDGLTNRKYLAVPTIAETLQQAGVRTVIAGAKPVALLHDRAEKRESGAAAKSVVLAAGKTLPASALEPITAALGEFPKEQDFPDISHNTWTTRALVEQLWKDEVPKFSLLWMNEPDLSQHQSGPGSPLALAALKSNDANLATLLEALDAKGLRATTDIFLVSDHGFSTISRWVDLSAELINAGFSASREFKEPPKNGDVLVVGNGGTVFFYIIGHDESVTARLVEFLQRSDYAGVIFSRAKIAGTFPLAQARIDTQGAPDVVMTFRWSDEKNASFASGKVFADGQRGVKQGTHSTLSSYDVHNTLIAAGPDFKRAWTDALPSGNVDVAPTVLAILGVAPLVKMDGRVLEEAFVGKSPEKAKVETKREATERDFDAGRWEQHLMRTQFGDHNYLDEGNGALRLK